MVFKSRLTISIQLFYLNLDQKIYNNICCIDAEMDQVRFLTQFLSSVKKKLTFANQKCLTFATDCTAATTVLCFNCFQVCDRRWVIFTPQYKKKDIVKSESE